MPRVDLNLLPALDALLTEGSVTGAARRLGLSVSAMSRTLTRLREATGDRLLLQAGRGLVLTPYAMQLRERIPALAREAQAALAPADHALQIATLDQCFTLRAGEGFIDLLAAPLLARIRQAAPQVRLRFAPKPDWDARPLREGGIDLEIGTLRTTAPELRTRRLFRDRYLGVCRSGHPLLDETEIDAERYTACGHVVASRAGEMDHPVDEALAAQGLSRQVAMVVPAYTHAMQVARQSDLLAVIPHSCLGNSFTPGHAAALGLRHFELPVPTPSFNVSAIWHPRLDQDASHRWLRGEVLALCEAAYP